MAKQSNEKNKKTDCGCAKVDCACGDHAADKIAQIDAHRVAHNNGKMTTNQGVGVPDDQEVLKAGERGPALLQDFVFREKITHFDHERIPERIVHARGFGAHGFFQVYEDMSPLTKANFLCDPKLKTPVFVRFSTVAGFRGSPDTVRDVRGFAVKFYTQEGNYDMVANNMPVFFVQDAIKFPDLIHALKPEPNNEIPQAQSAHDTFWDFIACNPESAHNMMWLMSDRALPRSYRMMDGFGIHTFKLVNAQGDFKFVKFHWKSLQGVHSLVWDETQKIAGKDPDFNRRDLWDAIENGDYPEWELGVQILDPKDEFKFDFDVLDCTKIWPEELIPVKRIGKMTLNRNVTNYFAETEQVAFCPANLVPGIDLSDDPMLQGRLFSYLDTQLLRLGGPNFHEIPINKPVVPIQNNQRDGFHRMAIDEGETSYYRNALQKGEPHPARNGESAFTHQSEKLEGRIVRNRSESFMDFFTQPSMFFNSMSDPEKQHIVDALRFELGRCKNMQVRQNVVDLLNHIDGYLSEQVAIACGVCVPKEKAGKASKQSSPALSMANQPIDPRTRKVAVLIDEGFDKCCVDKVCNALHGAGAYYEVVAPKQGTVHSADGETMMSGQTFSTTASVLYDAVFVPGGAGATKLMQNGDTRHFIEEAYKHYKPVFACEEGVDLLAACGLKGITLVAPDHSGCIDDKGVLSKRGKENTDQFVQRAVELTGGCRHFERGEHVQCVSA